VSGTMDGETSIEIARHDERLKALDAKMERIEEAGQRALELASEETARRLELLNGSYQREAEARHNYVVRELHDSCFAAVEKRLSQLEGRSWILYVAAAGAVAALVSEAVRLMFHT